MVDCDHLLYCLQMNQQHFPSGVMPPFAPPSAAGGSGSGHPLAPPHFNPAILNAVYQQHQQMMNSASNGGSKEERRNEDQVRISTCVCTALHT